jgi:argininosuccinate lyase
MDRTYILATDLADYLVGKGESFRTAHGIVGKLVLYAEGKGKSFGELSLKEYRKFSPLFDEDVYNITAKTSAAARNHMGGTAPLQVKRALGEAKQVLRAKDH